MAATSMPSPAIQVPGDRRAERRIGRSARTKTGSASSSRADPCSGERIAIRMGRPRLLGRLGREWSTAATPNCPRSVWTAHGQSLVARGLARGRPHRRTAPPSGGGRRGRGLQWGSRMGFPRLPSILDCRRFFQAGDSGAGLAGRPDRKGPRVPIVGTEDPASNSPVGIRGPEPPATLRRPPDAAEPAGRPRGELRKRTCAA